MTVEEGSGTSNELQDGQARSQEAAKGPSRDRASGLWGVSGGQMTQFGGWSRRTRRRGGG